MGHVWLIGMMGSGKTSAGAVLGGLLGLPFIDADDVVAARAGTAVSEIFAHEGEQGFRQRERTVIADLAAGEPAVIATGGGAPLDPANADTMRATGTVVLLEASEETLHARLSEDEERPLLSGPDREGAVVELARSRAPTYRGVAHRVVSSDGRSPAEIAAEIAGR